MLGLVVIATLVHMTVCLNDPSFRIRKKCENVKTGICKNNVHSNYNSTLFPNFLNHETQEEANSQISHYAPLIKSRCSKSLATFLCSLYIPMCSPSLPRPIPPCRSLCEASRDGCEALIVRFGYKWQFNCDLYPMEGTQLCIGAKIITKMAVKKVSKPPKNKQKGWVKVNENGTVKLSCDSKHIYIKKIRQSKTSSCCPVATKAVLSAMCNGRRRCKIKNTLKTLGGHCAKSVGHLYIKFKCKKNSVGCDGNQL